MTLSEAKDYVAKQKGYRDWPDLCARDHITNIEHSTDWVAQLFADSQYNQALTDIEGIIEKDKDAVGLLRKSVLIEELKRLKR